MNIYTNGYAIADIRINEVAVILKSIATTDNPLQLTAFKEGRPYIEWMGREVELKGFNKGIYLETEYQLGESQLAALSLKSKGVLSLMYYQNMVAYGCSYFLDGRKVLERLTAVGSNMMDEDTTKEFTGHPTQTIIENLFELLTGATITEAVTTKGTMYEFIKRSTL